jgi:prepilin-type N-terminal cleavage/methylation domain-containing protein
MKETVRIRKKESGFSLIELLVVIAIIAILAAIAIPGFSAWLPNYRLRQAARDVYSNLQRAKVGAIKTNENWCVFFDQANAEYSIWSLGPNKTWDNGAVDDTPQNITINLGDYEGVNYGHGDADKGVDSVAFGPDITYPSSVAIFTPRGTASNLSASGEAYVYLSNLKGLTYGVGNKGPAGVIIIRRHDGNDWK